MSRSRRLLIVVGVALTVWSASFGLWYAVFDEHQTLERMGVSLATGFARAAERRMAEAHGELDAYAATRFEYVREVDVHSHWGGLAMLLIVLGVVFDRVGWQERVRERLAAMLAAGSLLFPLGVILQTAAAGPIPRVLAAVAAGLVIAALTGVAVGFARAGHR